LSHTPAAPNPTIEVREEVSLVETAGTPIPDPDAPASIWSNVHVPEHDISKT